MKRIGPINQNLIFPLGKTCKCFGHFVPGHSKKNHFASRCLFLGGSHCSMTKLIHNFSEAVGTSAIAKLYVMACLQCPLCERLCESSCSNGSDFHKLSVLKRAFDFPYHLNFSLCGKLFTKHRQTAFRLSFCCLVLQNVPVLGQAAVLDPDNIRGDPGNRRAMS